MGDAFFLVWNQGILNPMINALVIMYSYLFNNFGLAILGFTLIVHFVTLPLTLRQIRQTKKMTEIQPRLQELKKRYGNDRERMSQETMRLYREFGVNPVGCLGPLVIQMPILIGMYWAIINVLPTSPERLMELGNRLYGGLQVTHQVVPVNGMFLTLDLAKGASEQTNMVAQLALPLLVAGSMWVMQKMSMSPSMDPNQAKQQRMMLWMMPLFFAFLAFSLPAGLSFYIFVSNLFRMVTQYFVSGWGALLPNRQPAPAPVGAAQGAQPTGKESTANGEARSARSSGQDRRRGNRDRSKGARRRSRRSRNRGA